MPKSCVAFGCSNHNMMVKKVSFHIFPDKSKKLEKWKQWVQAMRRVNADGSTWYPGSKYAYVCSEHFQTGQPSADPNHPDYIPNVFKFKKQDEDKSKTQLQRYESAKKRTKYEYPVPARSSVHENEAMEMPFQVLSSQIEPEVNEAMEIDFVRQERDLQTKMSCIEQQYLCREEDSTMNDTEIDAKIPDKLCIKKEAPDPSEEWLDIKEECVEYSAQADAACEYQFPSLLLPHLKQEPGDESIPYTLSKTSICKETNCGVYQDARKNGKDVKYNASCDTPCGSKLTSLLQPIEQVFVKDFPESDGERKSASKYRYREEASTMEDTEKDAKIPEALSIKKEAPDPSEDWLDIKEESVEYSAQADAACEDQFSRTMLLPPKQEPGGGSFPDSRSKTSVCKIYVDEEKKIVSTECKYPRGASSCSHADAVYIYGTHITSTHGWKKRKVEDVRQKSVTEMYPGRNPEYKPLTRHPNAQDRAKLYGALKKYGRFTGLFWLMSPEPKI